MINGLTYEEWLARFYRPIAGAEEGDGSGSGDGDDGDKDGSGAGGSDDGDGDGDGSGDGDGDGDGDGGNNDDDDDSPGAQLAKAERMRADAERERDAAKTEARKARQEARQAREKAAQESGNWESVAKERAAEVEDLKERVTSAEERATAAEHSLDKFQRDVRVTRLASKFGYKDPRDASLHLNEDQTGDDKSCERALRELAKEKPYLVDERRASGGAINGSRGGSLTHEQLKNMTPEEINARWDQEVSVSLAAGG